MVTDGIMEAVERMIDGCRTSEEKGAMEVLREMLGDFDEDKWYEMSDDEKQEWISEYMRDIDNIQGLESDKSKFYYVVTYSFDAEKQVYGPFDTEKEAIEDMMANARNEYKIDTKENEWDSELKEDVEIGEISIINRFSDRDDVTKFFVIEKAQEVERFVDRNAVRLEDKIKDAAGKRGQLKQGGNTVLKEMEK